MQVARYHVQVARTSVQAQTETKGLKSSTQSNHIQIISQKQTEGLAHQTLFSLATTDPKYIPLSNPDSPDNNPYYCLFRTSDNNNSHYCQHCPNRIHTIF